MRGLAIALAIVGLASSPTSAQRSKVQARPAQFNEAAAKFCRTTAYTYVQGKGRDVKAFLYFDECMRRGGRM